MTPKMKLFFLGTWGALGIMLTGMGLVSTIQSILSVEIVSLPKMALEAYRMFRDYFFEITLEWWIPFKLPILLKDLVSLYGFCSITVYNYYKFNGNLEEWGRLSTLAMGPIYIYSAIWHLANEESRKANPQHIMFYLGHLVAVLLFGFIAVIFFI